MTRSHLTITTVVLAVCLLVPAAALEAGAWERSWDFPPTATTTRFTVNGELLLLRNGTMTPHASIPSVAIPITFHPEQGQAMPSLRPGESEAVHVFLVYSTADYEGTTYASVSTVVCVPKSPRQPFVWEPRHFQDRTPSGFGNNDAEDPRHALHTAGVLPALDDPSNASRPWLDYTLWIYKDYDKAYPLDELEQVFAQHARGTRTFFQVHFDQDGTRPDGYVSPSPIDETSLGVAVDATARVTVSFTDPAVLVVRDAIRYTVVVEQQATLGLTWREIATQEFRAVQGVAAQRFALSHGFEANKKCRVRVTATYGAAPSVKPVERAFATVPGTNSGGRGDDEGDSPHMFDLRNIGE